MYKRKLLSKEKELDIFIFFRLLRKRKSTEWFSSDKKVNEHIAEINKSTRMESRTVIAKVSADEEGIGIQSFIL